MLSKKIILGVLLTSTGLFLSCLPKDDNNNSIENTQTIVEEDKTELYEKERESWSVNIRDPEQLSYIPLNMTYLGEDFQLAHIKMNAKEMGNAKPYIERLYKKFPTNLDVLRLYARYYTSKTSPDQSYFKLTKIIEQAQKVEGFDSHPMLQYYYAMSQFFQGNIENAKKTLEYAMSLEPDLPAVRGFKQMMDDGHVGPFLGRVQKYVNASMIYGDVHYVDAYDNLRSGEYIKAKIALEKVLRKHHSDLEYQRLWSWYYIDTNNGEYSYKELGDVLEKAKKNKDFINHQQLLEYDIFYSIYSQNSTRAKQSFGSLIKLLPKYTDPYGYKKQIEEIREVEGKQRYEWAIEVIDRSSLSFIPYHLSYLGEDFQQAHLKMNEKNMGAAKPYIKLLLDKHGNELDVLRLEARYYTSKTSPEQSYFKLTKIIEQAQKVEGFDSHPMLQYYYAMSQFFQGNIENAKKTLEYAMSLQDGLPAVRGFKQMMDDGHVGPFLVRAGKHVNNSMIYGDSNYDRAYDYYIEGDKQQGKIFFEKIALKYSNEKEYITLSKFFNSL